MGVSGEGSGDGGDGWTEGTDVIQPAKSSAGAHACSSVQNPCNTLSKLSRQVKDELFSPFPDGGEGGAVDKLHQPRGECESVPQHLTGHRWSVPETSHNITFS